MAVCSQRLSWLYLQISLILLYLTYTDAFIRPSLLRNCHHRAAERHEPAVFSSTTRLLLADPSSSPNVDEDSTKSPSLVTSFLKDKILLGIDPSPELAAIVTIYFVQGALGLARLAQTYLLKDTLHLGPAELSGLTGLFSLPWTIKPLYGFLSDGYKLFGYRRKSYLIVAGLLAGVCYLLLGTDLVWDSLDASTAMTGTVIALTLASACIAMSDVVADGIVVQETQKYANDDKVAGGLQSLCWGAASAGSILSAYYSGSLLEVLSVRNVFGITAVLPFLVAAISFGVNEQKDRNAAVDENNDSSVAATRADEASIETGSTKSQGMQEQLDLLWSALRKPSIYKPAAFIFLWQATPTADGAFFFFLSNDLGLGPEFLGRVRLLTAGAGLVGVFLYQTYLKTASIKNVLFWCTLASFPLGMLPVLLITHVNRALGIPDTALIFGDDAALAALGQISFMPTLVLAARLCPPGIEAVLFATLMSINNAAGTLGTELGALLTKMAGITGDNFDNLAWLTVVCNVSSLIPLLFIDWLDETEGGDNAKTVNGLDKAEHAPEICETSVSGLK